VRLAIVSDIHGNLTAFEAVLADLRLTAPDLIWHGGDLAHAGSSPAEVVDRLREIGWPGVLGNTDEMLFDSEPLQTFAGQSAAMAPLLPLIEEMASATNEALGAERLAWLRELPLSQVEGPLAVYGHVHRSYIRALGPLLTVANSGSVSLSHDGDPRASYLLIDDATPTIRRVEYDVDREITALSMRRFPHWEWTAKMLANARPQMP
jgi:predicted phosphodiesterase